MVDRPIIFSAPMVTALLDGTKTQTRRLAWKYMGMGLELPSETQESLELRGWRLGANDHGCALWRPSPWQKVTVGDRLWVRENFTPQTNCTDGVVILYEASRTRAGSEAKVLVPVPGNLLMPRLNVQRPSIHMPRWASRLTLVVTEVRRQSLHDITDSDAMAEGVVRVRNCCYVVRGFGYDTVGLCHTSPVTAFGILWDSLHGTKLDEAFGGNPEVIAITFAIHCRNIDAMGDTP